MPPNSTLTSAVERSLAAPSSSVRCGLVGEPSGFTGRTGSRRWSPWVIPSPLTG